MPGGTCGRFPGITKKQKTAEYKKEMEEYRLLHEIGRERLVELAKAEKAGRLVVLPCKEEEGYGTE